MENQVVERFERSLRRAVEDDVARTEANQSPVIEVRKVFRRIAIAAPRRREDDRSARL